MNTLRHYKRGDVCVCEWPKDARRFLKKGTHALCNGAGVQSCTGCGGDGVCVCVCGGTRDCQGCDACEGKDQTDEDVA